MPRILRNLRVSEVSGVDKGAGRGVKIVMMKRDAATEQDMEKFWSDEARTAAAEARRNAGQNASHHDEKAAHHRDKAAKTKDPHERAVRMMAAHAHEAAASSYRAGNSESGALHAAVAHHLWHSFGKRDDDETEKVPLDQFHSAVDAALDGDDLEQTLDREFTALKRALTEDDEMTEDQVKKAIADALKEQADKHAAELAKRDAELALAKMSDKQRAYFDKCNEEQKKKFSAMSSDEKDDCVSKDKFGLNKRDVDPHAAELAKRDDRITELEKQLGGMLLTRQQEDFRKRAVDLGLSEADGEIMRKAFSGDVVAQGELQGKVIASMKALREQAKTGQLFREFGKSNANGEHAASAMDELRAKAAELRKAEPKLSEHQAFAKAYTDPANRDLALRHKAEESQRLAKIAAGTQ